MGPIAIRAEAIGKQYRLGRVQNTYPTLRESLISGSSRMLRHAAAMLCGRRPADGAPPTFWALQDVSFEIAQGEAVGLIGNNGAGKSTLLKILSRITEPTKGYAEIHGRLGSLLEVGTGFHPELTGRENIFLNGAVLGMKRSEIGLRFDEIVSFAEIGQFVDTPVKYYSSGMYLRLAFAVAAHLEPEILLVDEVLAVGDAAFQKKCLGKMSDVTRQGRTVVFVSHNMVAMRALCERVIWLQDGRIREQGDADRIISNYLRTSLANATEQSWSDPAVAPGNDRIRLRHACVRPQAGSPRDPIDVRTDFVMQFEYWNMQPDTYLSISLHVRNEEGIVVFNTGSQPRRFPLGLFRDTCRVPGDLMNDGAYRVELVVQDRGQIVYEHPDILTFEMVDSPEMRGNWYGRWVGVVRPMLEWATERIDAPTSEMKRDVG